MRLHELRSATGARKASRRVGRGHGSGRGTTAGRGTKGQKARTGGAIPAYFEGGQLPLVKRLPYRRGFTNKFRRRWDIVNLGTLNMFGAGTVVTPDLMKSAGIISSVHRVKILAGGTLTRPLHIKGHGFSRQALEKIASAGGTAEELSHA